MTPPPFLVRKQVCAQEGIPPKISLTVRVVCESASSAHINTRAQSLGQSLDFVFR